MISPDSASPLPASAGDPAPAPSSPVGAPVGLAGNTLFFVVVGIAGGAAACVLMGLFENYFELPSTVVTSGPAAMALMGNPEKTREVQELVRQVAYRNTLLAMGLLGTAIAGAFGLGEGLARKSLRAAVLGTLWGIALGGALGTLGGVALNVIDARFQQAALDVLYRILTLHVAVFGLTGLAAGLATSLHTLHPQTIGRVTLMAVLGGCLGAILYIPLGVLLVFVSSSNQNQAIPDGTWNRLCWTLVAGVTIGALMGLARKRKSPVKAA